MKKKPTRAEKAAEKHGGYSRSPGFSVPHEADLKYAAFLAGYKLAKRHAVEAVRSLDDGDGSISPLCTESIVDAVKERLK